MKKITLLTAIAMIAFTVSTFGQVSTTASAGATIVEPLTITKTQDLDFGILSGDELVTTIAIVDANGAYDGTNSTADLMGGGTAAATFEVTGQADEPFSITLPGDTDVELTGTGTPMGVTNFVSSLDVNNEGAVTGGTITVSVGATLNLGVDQTVGDYNGTFTVAVQYL